ncbi:hypothetical protein IWW52_004291 [Coemansia sp. RSA 2704]|nr:hypothetical protein IWW52_004291 [Coemansia sp. RSA 2704]
MAAAQQPHHQQQPPRSASRAGPGGMWPGQMGMNNLFGGGFGTMGIGAAPMSAGPGGPMSPVTPQYYSMQQQVQSPMAMNGPGSRPGSSLQHSHPSRPATSTGFHGSAAEGDTPVLVNVARGGARVIGPMRAKQAQNEGPSFLNPIPQSPSSALGNAFPKSLEASSAAREHIRSALSNHSLESGRSRSNSALQPTEESMEAAEARVSRKIQDLEISNTSLMAVNTQLESRVKAQREQIAELKKQLQLKASYIPEVSADIEEADEDAKAALEYRSTIAAGKVISAAELNEDDSQVTVNTEQESPDAVASTSADTAAKSEDNAASNADRDTDRDNHDNDGNDDDKSEAEPEVEADAVADAEADAEAAKLQEARELVARLMVLALSSPDPTTPEKPASRIPKRMVSAAAVGAARPPNALKGGLRTPAKSTSARISSFGVASTSTPVRSVAVSPTPSSKASADSSKEQIPGEKEQMLDICRKLQQLL